MFQVVAPEFYRSSKKQWYKHYMYKTYDEHIFADDTETDPRDAEFLPAPRKENRITIGELSRDAGVTLRALRLYQSKGLLTPQRDGTSRIFSSADRARLALVQQGKRLGFTLGEIRLMLVARHSQPLGECARILAISHKKCVEQIKLLENQRRDLELTLAELRQIYTAMSMTPDVSRAAGSLAAKIA